MAVVKLQMASEWLKTLESAAADSGQELSDYLLGIIASSCPPPRSRQDVLEDEVLVKMTRQICRSLDQTKGELLQALSRLVPDPRQNPVVASRRRHTAARLKRARQTSGLRYVDIAESLGVSQAAVGMVFNGTMSLPPAWIPTLKQLFGDDFMSE